MLAKEVEGRVYTGGGECPTGNCPSVLQRSDGQVVVVGKRLSNDEVESLNSSGLVKVHDDEFAVLVTPELLTAGTSKIS